MSNINLVKNTLSFFTLPFVLSACVNLQSPEPAEHANIPLSFYSSTNGQSIAQQSYKTFISDQRLLQVIQLALDNNRDLRTAVLNIQKAQQQYQITQNDQLPNIGVSASVIREIDSFKNPNNPYSTYQVGVEFTDYELDLWGRLKSLKDSALNQYLATQNNRDAVQISLIAQVSNAWLNYALASAQLKLAEQTVQTQLQSYEMIKKRFKAGVDNELPLHQSEILLETSRNDVANFKTQILQAENLLNLLVGQQVPKNLLSDQSIASISNETVFTTGLPSDLLNNRPDLKAAQYQLRAAGANIGVAKARLFPNITLTATTGFASTQLKELFNAQSFSWSIGPSLDLPIWDWGTRKAGVKISEIEQQTALAQYEKTIQTAFREVNDALATKMFISDRISAQERLVKSTYRSFQLSQNRFKSGLDSYLAVLDSERSTYAAQQNLLVLQQAKLNNQIELYKSLGGGLEH
nr:AdeC/AdeK/OprM family multidrug efflux complex outer membrane factor [Acinetobacter sp. Marseille-Q1620]